MTDGKPGIKGVSQSFLDRADSAAFFEAWVGAVLARCGLYTQHHPFVVDGGEYHHHSWDLDVCAGDMMLTGMKTAHVEVKSVDLTFHGPDDYPFDTVLLCSQSSYMKKYRSEKLPRNFLLVSRKTGNIVWVPVGSKVELGVEVLDKSRSEVYKAVVVKRNSLRKLSDFVKEIEDQGTGLKEPY